MVVSKWLMFLFYFCSMIYDLVMGHKFNYRIAILFYSACFSKAESAITG